MFLLSSKEIMKISGGKITEGRGLVISVTDGSIYDQRNLKFTDNGKFSVHDQLIHDATIDGVYWRDMILFHPIENGYHYVFTLG